MNIQLESDKDFSSIFCVLHKIDQPFAQRYYNLSDIVGQTHKHHLHENYI